MKFIYSILVFVIFSCENKSITITKEKIVNHNWNPNPREGRNGMIIQKVIVANDSLYYYLDKGFLNYSDFQNDSNFHYKVHFGTKKVNEIYFDRNYDWKWIDIESKNIVDKIGLLRNDSWYKFSGLTNNTKFYLFVYIDEKGISHQYSVNNSNF